MQTGRRPPIALSSLLRRSLSAIALFVLAACSPAPPPGNPVQDIINATPANQVALHVFRDSVVIANKTTTSARDCVVVLDGNVRAELAALEAGQLTTIMRTRFRPYTETDAFYALSFKPRRMECLVDGKASTITFGEPTEHSVVIPPKK